MKTAAEYQCQIDFENDDYNVCEAASLAIWLVVDKESALKRAVKIGAKKFNVKQAPTERMIKSILPDDFFSKRAKANMTPELKAMIRDKKIAEYNAKKRM